MTKEEIALILEKIATLLEIKGENSFRVRAYQKAARALLAIEEDLKTVIKENKLISYDGIGDHTAEKIKILYEKGKLPYYEELKKSIPKGLLSLTQIPGLGPKKVKILYQKLKIKSKTALKKAAKSNLIAKIKGFGKKTEENILKSLEKLETYQKKSLWFTAYNQAIPILEKLKKLKNVKKVELCGSLRRKVETVSDLDFLVATDNPKPVIDYFSSLGTDILAKGKTKCSIRLDGDIQADLRVLTLDQYIYGLIYFTGSKEHNIKLRNRALKMGLHLNEYGFTPPLKKKIRREEEFYQALKLSYIPPELRENLGEIEFAEKHKFPKLIEEKDIRGTFHNHTTASDGKNTLHQMVEKAIELKWDYIGISDHSKSSFQANGLNEEALLEQIETIKKINRSKKYKIHIFSGTECDILKNGNLDFDDEVLKKLDFVIASVHNSLQQDEKTMTKRIIKALENPYTTMLGHPTGRLLLKREASKVNLSKVIDAAIKNNKIIELNGNPMRLDMDWRFWKEAKDKGLMCCINCDAHTTHQLEFVQTAVNIARKGWLTKEDIFNTKPLAEIKKLLKTYQDASS